MPRSNPASWFSSTRMKSSVGAIGRKRKMSSVIKEMATDSIELGVMAALILMIFFGLVTWFASGGNIWWTIGVVLFCLWLCRLIGRVSVGSEEDKTRRIRGGCWGGW